MMEEIQQDIVIYQSKDGAVEFGVNVFEDTVWVTQADMVELFERNQSVISRHIQNAVKESEIDKNSNMQKMHIANSDKPITLYDLNVIISVGYRVKSLRGVHFRQWATKVLKQYMLQGYAANAVRLSNIEKRLDTSAATQASKEDVQDIKQLLQALANKPINININNQLGSSRLEEKLIELIDQVKDSLQSEALQTELSLAKQDIASCSTDVASKERLIGFFAKLGDSKSSLNKAIKGAGIAKNIISEILKLGHKLKDLL